MFWFFVKLVRFSSFKKNHTCCDFFSHSKSILYFVFKFGFVFYLRGLPLPPTHPTGQEHTHTHPPTSPHTHTHTHTHNPMIFPWKPEAPNLIFPEPGPISGSLSAFPESLGEEKTSALGPHGTTEAPLTLPVSWYSIYMLLPSPRATEASYRVSSPTQPRAWPWAEPLYPCPFRRDPSDLPGTLVSFFSSDLVPWKIGYSFTPGFHYLTSYFRLKRVPFQQF